MVAVSCSSYLILYSLFEVHGFADVVVLGENVEKDVDEGVVPSFSCVSQWHGINVGIDFVFEPFLGKKANVFFKDISNDRM